MNRYLSIKTGFWLCLVIILGGCTWEVEPELQAQVWGKRPVYGLHPSIGDTISQAPRPLDGLGNLLVIGDYLFIVQRGWGVHVLDNSDPSAPINLAFLALTGVLELTYTDGFLYAPIGSDLFVIDISNIDFAIVSNVVVDAFEIGFSTSIPQFYTGYFECVDESRGPVQYWEDAELSFPECYIRD